MKKNYSISGKELPGQLMEVLNELGKVFVSRNIDFFIVGATARDILLEHIHKSGIRQATLDVDFAVYVPDWNAYELLMKDILSSGNFKRGDAKHKVIYKESHEVDIVPFGDIQDEKGEILWPPEETRTMSVLGFTETFENSINLVINETRQQFKVVSLPGLAVLKIIAWNDRDNIEKKKNDAMDLGFIIENYFEINLEIIFGSHEDLVVAKDFDKYQIAARVLGRDIGELIKNSPKTKQQIIAIFEEEISDKDNSNLAENMYFQRSYHTSFRLLENLFYGIQERKE